MNKQMNESNELMNKVLFTSYHTDPYKNVKT